jgi:ketosteroid isomerase-like protein
MIHNLLPSKLLAAAVTAIVLFSCNQPKTTATFDAVATKAAIEQRNQAFVDDLKKGDSVALTNFYTDDAQLLGGGPAATGHKQIQAEMSGFIQAGIINAKLITEGVWGTDSLVTEQGRAVFSNKANQVMTQGAYMVVWKKVGGDWKLFRDMYAADAPPPAKK